jgi:hypothetical protein
MAPESIVTKTRGGAIFAFAYLRSVIYGLVTPSSEL